MIWVYLCFFVVFGFCVIEVSVKRFLTIVLLLNIFISCNNRSLKEYLEQGFATPKFDAQAYFTSYSEGDGKKIYVPSEQDVEVRFAITNTYNKELKATLTFPKSHEGFFERVPTITNLGFTNLVVSFKFKKEAEPKDNNGFLGVSVPIELRLFDAKIGRKLGTKVFNANCNTAPLPIDENAISYNLEEDEYTIHLPKNEGKHIDLREVKVEVSTKQGKTKKEKIISIENAEDQDKNYILKVKNFLEYPSGEREIKVTVFDKAGICSKQKNKTGKLIFANITLIPSTKQIRFEDSLKDIPIPEIKELKEYFKNNKDWKDALYNVEYTMPVGSNFVYDEVQNKIKNTTTTTGEHKVKLKDSLGNSAEADYVVTIISGENAELNKEKLKITDKTIYTNKIGKTLILDASSINFTETSGVYIGTMIVPYTSYDTELKVNVLAFDEQAHVQNLSETGLVGTNEKEFTTSLLTDSNCESNIEFKVVSQSGNVTKNYKIVFRRGESVKVTLNLKDEVIADYNGAGKITLEWDYGKKEHTDIHTTSFANVAKNAMLKFTVKANEGSKIASITSTDIGHVINGAEKTEVQFNLKAKNDFEINVQLSPEITVKWEHYKDVGISDGYISAKMIYENNGLYVTKIPTNPSSLFVVPKSCNITFSILGLSSNYEVTEWKVNDDSVKETRDEYELSSDKTELNVKNVQKSLVVYVLTTQKTFKISWSVEEGHGVTIEVKKGGETITEQPYYIERGASMTFTPKVPQSSGYEVEGWKVGESEYHSSVNQTGIKIGVNWILTLSNITEDKNIVLLLKKLKHKLSVKIDFNGSQLPSETNLKVYIDAKENTIADINEYEYQIEHGKRVNLNANITSDLKIDSWECRNQSGTLVSTVLQEGPTENVKQLDMTESYSVTLKLKRKTGTKAIFRIKKFKTEHGKLIIRDTNTVLSTLIANGSEFEFETDGNKAVNLIVNELDTSDRIIAWRDSDGNIINKNDWIRNGWYSNNITVKPKINEVIELNIARVSQIWFKKPENATSETHYNEKYEINITKSSDDTEVNHILLPVGGLKITKKNANEDKRSVYIVEGTKIHIEVTRIPANHKLYPWILQGTPPANFNIAEWNSSTNEGKIDFDYICNYDGKAYVVAKIGEK